MLNIYFFAVQIVHDFTEFGDDLFRVEVCEDADTLRSQVSDFIVVVINFTVEQMVYQESLVLFLLCDERCNV